MCVWCSSSLVVYRLYIGGWAEGTGLLDTPTHTQMEVDSLILKLSPMHTRVLDNVELQWNQGCLVALYRTCRHTHEHTAHV